MNKTKKFFCEFDETTKTKLTILEEYLKKWLPVFINTKASYIYIFDFFAGPGCDSKGYNGSPIITLKQIQKYLHIISGTKIYLFLNDNKKQNFTNLKTNCETYLRSNPVLNDIIKCEYFNELFENSFKELKDKIGKYPSLVFMDQFGVKYAKYIKEFENFNTTDFMIFISSSSLRRFAKTSEFKNALSLDDVEIKKLKNTPYKLIHECVKKILESRLCQTTKLKLYCFSLKKGRNIYGLVFGTKNISAADKFLHIAWGLNPNNGMANYDIYGDKDKTQATLFPDLMGKTTLQLFQDEFKDKILSEKIKTNLEAYLYTLDKGFLPKHAKEVLQNLKNDGKINYKAKSPLISYKTIYRNKRIINYEKN